MKAMNRWGTLRGLGTSLAAAVVASVAIATPVMATGRDQDEGEPQSAPTSYEVGQFTAQALAEGLTAEEAAVLQQRVDEVIAKTRGKQIAANQVLWADGSGDTTVPLPGEKRARTLGEPMPQAADCPYLHFCTWTGYGYTGDRQTMKECKMYPIWAPFRSWENNQSDSAVAWFYGMTPPYPPGVPRARKTPPAYSRNSRSEEGRYAFWVDPCTFR